MLLEGPAPVSCKVTHSDASKNGIADFQEMLITILVIDEKSIIPNQIHVLTPFTLNWTSATEAKLYRERVISATARGC